MTETTTKRKTWNAAVEKAARLFRDTKNCHQMIAPSEIRRIIRTLKDKM